MNANVLGIESQVVQTYSKHFIGSEQETQRIRQVSANGTITEALSSYVNDRTLHKRYWWPFADAVRAGTASVKCAYSRINGRHASDDREMLAMLKDRLTFPGYVVSDWFAIRGTDGFANAVLDLEMPGNVSAAYGASYFGTPLLQAVEDGSVPMDRLHQDSEDFPLSKSYPCFEPKTVAANLQAVHAAILLQRHDQRLYRCLPQTQNGRHRLI